MHAIIRRTTDVYGSGDVVLLAPDEDASYSLAADEISRLWLPEISLPIASDFENDGEGIVAELRDELQDLLSLSGKDLVEAWNGCTFNKPDEFDVSRRITYAAAAGSGPILKLSPRR